MSFLHSTSTPLLLSRGITGALGLIGSIMGARAIIQPSDFAQTHGFITPETSNPRNPFIPICGAQMIATGLTYLTLVYLREDRALGVCMVASLVTGFFDGRQVLRVLPAVDAKGTEENRAQQETRIAAARSAGYAHWAATAICAAVGASLLSVS